MISIAGCLPWVGLVIGVAVLMQQLIETVVVITLGSFHGIHGGDCGERIFGFYPASKEARKEMIEALCY